ncbi:hypothetical protein [Chitinophaga sp. MM2321]|uniref:beta strand repeat-containing protein n=1 Tax=Chitinophaga sp. MM2321 TaxID=3137178 RepID=UPI0032D56962
MKNLLIFILTIFGISASAQIYQPNNVYGTQFKRIKVDSTFYLPTDTLLRSNLNTPGAIAYNIGDTSIYVYNGLYWVKTIGGGSSGIALALDSARRSNDTLFFRLTNGGELAVKMTGIPQVNIVGLPDSLALRMKYSDTASLSNRIDNTEDSIQANDLQRVTERGNITNRELILDAGSGAGAGRLRMRTAGANVIYSYETGATAFKPLLLAAGGLLVSNPSGSPVTWDGNSSIQISGDGKVNDNWTVGGDLSVTGSALFAQQKNNIAEDSVLATDIAGHLKMVAKSSITSAYTPLTRALTVGTGMTGGGDFSADRSVGLDYSYLDDRYLSGYKQRAAVRVATIANITLSAPQTIDGVSAIAGDRVLVKNQTTGSQNGIYIVAAGAWSRSTDFDQAIPGEIEQGSQIFVQEGTNNNKTGWSLATSGVITVGTTTLTFIQYAGANSYAAGTGLALAGNTFSALNTTALWNANKLQGIGVSSTAPATSQLLRYDGTNWAPWTSNFLTGNQTITATGDATGSGTTSIPLTLKNTGTTGTYTKVTTDAQGRVTVGTNPTTLAGYGITDAAPSTGSANYIQNQNASAQTANSWISGNMRANNFYGNAGIGSLQFGMLNGTAFRWGILLNGAESANAGSNWTLLRYNDAGTTTTVMEANRSTGIISMPYGFRAANGSGIIGTGAGVSNNSFFRFYESNATTEIGGIGKANTTINDIQITSLIGSIGIVPFGTTSGAPAALVSSTDFKIAAGLLSLQNGTSNTISASGELAINAAASSKIGFGIGSSEKVTISSSGILSVGNVSPSTLRSSPLQVQGNVWSTDAYILGTGVVPLGEFGIGGSGIFVRSMDNVTNIDFMTNGTTVRGKWNATTGNLEVNNQIKIAGGAPGVGKKLTSDASGLATWSGAVTTATRAVTGNVTITVDDYSIDLKGTSTGSTHTLTLPNPATSEGRELEFFATASTASAWTANYPIYNRNQDTMPPFTRPNILGREKIKVISGKWVVVAVQD